MPRRNRSKCTTRGCPNPGPYSCNLGLCKACGSKRMKKGDKKRGKAGSVENKRLSGRIGGLAGSAEDKKTFGRTGGRCGSIEAKEKAGKRSGLRRKTSMALVVKKCWLDKILSRKKDWEIRSSATKRRGWIHLVQSKSGSICGGAYLVNCFPVERNEFLRYRHRHCVQNLKDIKYKKIWAWVMKGAKKYSAPFKYNHNKGAVIFVSVRKAMGPPAV